MNVEKIEIHNAKATINDIEIKLSKVLFNIEREFGFDFILNQRLFLREKKRAGFTDRFNRIFKREGV